MHVRYYVFTAFQICPIAHKFPKCLSSLRGEFVGIQECQNIPRWHQIPQSYRTQNRSVYFEDFGIVISVALTS